MCKTILFQCTRNQHQEQDTTQNDLLSSVDSVSLGKSRNSHMSWKPCTSRQVGKDFITSGYLANWLLTTCTGQTKSFKLAMTCQSANILTAEENVRKPWAVGTHLLMTRVSLQEATVFSVLNVRSLFPEFLPSVFIREFTLEKGLMSAVNVGNSFLGVPCF